MKKYFFIMLFISQILANDYNDLVKKCNEKDQNACKELINLLANDCMKNDKKDACDTIMTIFIKAKDKQSMKAALKVAEKGCELGSLGGCLFAAASYEVGKNVKRDPSKVIKYGDKICKSDVENSKEFCVTISKIYATDPRYKNINKATQYAKIACDGGATAGCYNVGKIYFDSKEYQKSYEYLKKACDNKYFDGCNQIGLMYNNGFGMEKDYKKAFEYFDLACKNGNMIACANQAGNYIFGNGVEQNRPKAIELFQKACNAKIKLACNYLIKVKSGMKLNKSDMIIEVDTEKNGKKHKKSKN